MKRRLGFYVVVLIAVLMVVLVLLSACGGGKPASSITPVESVKMTHPVKGFDDCRSCHATGTSGAKAFSAAHANYTNKDCNLCHKAP